MAGKFSEWYGSGQQAKATTALPMALPSSVAGAGTRPVKFWLIMVGLLVVTRFLYESAE